MLNNSLDDASDLIWEKRPTEPPKAFGAFKVYRDLPAHRRSLAKAVKEMYGSEGTASKLRQFQLWSSKYHWVARSSAWDEEQDRVAREEQLKQVKEMRIRHVQISKALQQKAIERLKDLDGKTLTINEMVQFILEGSRLERLSLGEPAELTRVDASVVSVDFSRLTDTELRSILGKRINDPSKTFPDSVNAPVDVSTSDG